MMDPGDPCSGTPARLCDPSAGGLQATAADISWMQSTLLGNVIKIIICQASLHWLISECNSTPWPEVETLVTRAKASQIAVDYIIQSKLSLQPLRILVKTMETKVFLIWNHHKCLSQLFRLIWIPMLWVYGHYKYFISYSAGIDFRRQNLRRQVQTSKVDPCTVSRFRL